MCTPKLKANANGEVGRWRKMTGLMTDVNDGFE